MKKSKEINNNEPIANTDSDDSSSDEFETDSNVVIGFVDDSIKDLTADEKLHSRILLKSPFFTSKLGGKPSWLNYNNLSSLTTNLKCSNCQFQMSFLLQIYAPITEQTTSTTTSVDDSFHRVLYVFVCNNNDCVSHGFKVFRSQLNRTNEFYSFDAPPCYEDGLESAEQCLVSFYSKLNEKNLFNLCSVCGSSCSKKCAKCSFSFYCSSAHQVHDWQKLNHKEICSKYLETTKIQDKIDYFIKNENKEKEELPSNVFSEYEILIEPEVLDLKKKESFKKYDETKLEQDLEMNLNLDQDTELDNLKESETDKDFEKFKKITNNQSDQVLRYERAGVPLWVTKYNKIDDLNVPACSHCGSKRNFEFQINPQLLTYLGLENNLTLKQINTSLDWAGLYVFTCMRNCTIANTTYFEEFIYKQDFIS